LVKRMYSADMEKEKLVEINEIYKELTQDALSLTNDLVDSIKMWPFGIAFLFLVAVLYSWLFVLPSWNANLFTALFSALMSGFMVLLGLFATKRYLWLRKKYARLFEIKKKLEEGETM
jgi:ABC-type multidrug transport system permease subunit